MNIINNIFGGLTELCINFILPLIVFLVLAGLLYSGRDGEVKTLLAGVVGWLIKSGVSTVKRIKENGKA